MLKLIYTLFLGIMIALFVGFGVVTFYPGPKVPEYPSRLEYNEPVKMDTPEIIEERKAFDAKQKDYNNANKLYRGRIFIIVIIAAVAILTLGLTLERRILILSDGLLLGGVLLLGYGLVNAFMTENTRYQFVAVTIGLIISLVLGWFKFIRGEKSK